MKITNAEAQLLILEKLATFIQEISEEEDRESAIEFAQLVVDTLSLRVISVDGDSFTAQINIHKKASNK